MARPLRARYANVAVTFDQSANVSTPADTISFGNHSFVNNALVVYTTSSLIGGLSNNGVYFVVNTTPTTIQLSTTRGGLPLDMTSAPAGTGTLTRVITDGVQEMSDSDLQDWVVPLIVNYWLNYPSSCPGTQLSFNNSTTTTISRGSATDTVRAFSNNTTASLNDHPVVANTLATHTLYQSQTTATPPAVGPARTINIPTARPVFYNAGTDRQIKSMTDNDLNDHFWPAFFSAADLDASAKASWTLSSTTPVATGTWTEKGSITDTFVTTGAPTTTTYKLYQRTDLYTTNASVFHIRPLYYDSTVNGLTEMTDTHIETLATYFYEYLLATGVGQYAFQTSTPTPGTWVNLGSYVNKLNNTSDTAYTGYFASSFTGAFTGIYTGAFTGQYGNQFTGAFTGPYVGSFTGAFSGPYAGSFTGAFSGNYAGSYVNAFTSTYVGLFSGAYLNSFTGLFSGSFTGAFSGIYSSVFTGQYAGTYNQTFTGTYSQSFAGSYVGLFSAVAYTGAYTGIYQPYYSGRLGQAFAGGYASVFMSSPGSGTEVYQVTGAFQGAYTGTAYYSGRAAQVNYTGYYGNAAYTGLGQPRAYANTFAGSYGNNIIYYSGRGVAGLYYFTGGYTGLFVAGAKGYGTAGYAGAPYGAQYTGTVYYSGRPSGVNYAGMYQAVWTGAKLDDRTFGVYATFAQAFTGNYTSLFAGGYTGSFTGSYSGSYSGSFTGAYNQSFSRLFTGTYLGSFTGVYTNVFSSSFSRFFSGAYTGAYSSAYSGTFTGTYNQSFTGTFTGAYTQAFTQGFTGVYSQSFTGIYNQAFTGAFSGAYTGLTVINTTTDTTTTLWLRSA